MKNKVIKLNERDITKIVEKLIKENDSPNESKPTEDKSESYYKIYQSFKSMDHKLADMINWLHVNFGLGVDGEDPFLKSTGEAGHKLMSLLRKGKELTSKVVKNHYQDVLNSFPAEERNDVAPKPFTPPKTTTKPFST